MFKSRKYLKIPAVAALPAAPRWPAASKLVRDPGRASLVLFLHPRCACSDATLAELERLIPATRGKVKNFVVFVNPPGLAKDWAKEKLWANAQSIPETESWIDEGGREAAGFGALTSGQAYLYDARGNLVFQGGITPSRGHRGDSDGREAIRQFANGELHSPVTTHVFGCSLRKPERQISEANDDAARL